MLLAVTQEKRKPTLSEERRTLQTLEYQQKFPAIAGYKIYNSGVARVFGISLIDSVYFSSSFEMSIQFMI